MSTLGPYNEQFYSKQESGSYESAKVVLSELFAITGVPKRVIDIGCGLGTWLRVATELGAEEIIGVDGAWVNKGRLHIDRERFIEADLSKGDYDEEVRSKGFSKFDLCISVEVAEHLAKEHAAGFVAALTRLADVVLLSAAIPDQGGTNHVNEAWPQFWARLFLDNAYVCFDIIRPRVWFAEGTEWWYLQNSILYARSGADVELKLSRKFTSTEIPLPLVHPRFFKEIIWNWKNRKPPPNT